MDKIDICKLGLSTRSTNALKRAGVITVEQLLKLCDDDINNIKNMGEKSVTEVRDLINKIKKEEITISESGNLNGVIVFEGKNNEVSDEKLLINIAYNQKDACVDNIAYVLNNQRVSDIHIDNMMFSNRSYNALAKNNIFYLFDIWTVNSFCHAKIPHIHFITIFMHIQV